MEGCKGKDEEPCVCPPWKPCFWLAAGNSKLKTGKKPSVLVVSDISNVSNVSDVSVIFTAFCLLYLGIGSLCSL